VFINYIFHDINFSRMIVGLSAVTMLVETLLSRGAINRKHSGSFFLDQKARSRLIIIGAAAEAQRVQNLLRETVFYNCEILGYVPPHEASVAGNSTALGEWQQLEELIRFYQADELVFCNQSLTTHQIIEKMSHLVGKDLQYKIVPPNADYLVGPNTILSTATVAPSMLNLGRREIRLQKRLFDGIVSLGLLGFFPLTFWIYQRPGAAFLKILKVLAGNYHWVGYIEESRQDLPPLKPGLLDMRLLNHWPVASKGGSAGKTQANLDRQYAYNYSPGLDMQILLRGLRNIGNRRDAA
jgi:hypothetical protein